MIAFVLLMQMVFPAGEVHLAEPLVITDGQTVTGAGVGKTVFVTHFATGAAIICATGLVPRVQPCVFRDFSIDTAVPRIAGAGILVIGIPAPINIIIENVHIQNQPDCVRFNSGVAFSFLHSVCSHVGANGNGVIIQNVDEPDAGDSVIDDVLFNDNYGHALAAIYHIDSGGLNIVNVKVLGFGYGYILDILAGRNTGQLDIAHSSFEHQRVVSLGVYGAGGYDSIDISHNHLTAQTYGIVLQSHHRSIIQSNRIVCMGGPGIAGIAITGTAHDVKVLDNSIFDCQADIVVHPTTARVQVRL